MEQRIHQFIQVLLHLFPADRAIHVQHQQLVGLDLQQDIQKRLIPVVHALAALQGLLGVFDEDPVHKVVDILKMVIKRHAVDAAVLGDIVDGDLVEGLLEQHLFQRRFQRPFRCL